MTHRFIADFQLKPGNLVLTDQELVHQIWNVLKLRPNEQIILCDGQSTDALANLVERNDKGILVSIVNITSNIAESPNKVALYCSILKKENFELVCQKATEVGVSEIIPVISDRTIKLNTKEDRLQKIIKEAAEQSGRGKVPSLKPSMSLEQAVGDSKRFDQQVCFDITGSKMPISGSTALFIGPEGGWSEQELELFKTHGFKTVSLGPRTLRAETAAIVATHLATS
ncbi:16S rRNA (uracil(1498)-N(3))-methyltransferase [Candidatus Parcubacteria bacterium]|nr:16S rRNA (uracil(1498)-N(3))-methyltransferase [Candidatus Parcubacteria bacterium]